MNRKIIPICLILFFIIVCFIIYFNMTTSINIETYPNTREDGLLYKSEESAHFEDINRGFYIYKDGTVIKYLGEIKEIGYSDMSNIVELQNEIEKLNFKPTFEKIGQVWDGSGLYGNTKVYNGKYTNGVIINYVDEECKDLTKESKKLNKKYNNIIEKIETLAEKIIVNSEITESSEYIYHSSLYRDYINEWTP